MAPKAPNVFCPHERQKLILFAVLRRSKRKRKLAYSSMSWLDDNQMPTAGYPNPKLVSTEYSEEDSRDAQVNPSNIPLELSATSFPRRVQVHQDNGGHDAAIDRTRRSTRHSHGLDNIGIHTRRRSKAEEVRIKEELEVAGNKENNGLIRRANGRVRKAKNDKEEEEEEGVDAAVEAGSVEDEQGEEQKQGGSNKEGGKREGSTESEESKKIQTRGRVNNRIMEDGDKYSRRRTRNHKISGIFGRCL